MEKLRRGAYLMLREASGAHNLLALLPAVTPLNCRRCCLATDDRHLDELVSEGSINYLIEIGTAHGYPVEQLLQMATLNTAERFRLYDRGALAPGYKADICVFNNLVNFQPQLVLKNGVVIVNKQKLLWQSPPLLKDPENTMHLEDVREQQLRLPVMNGRKARVIRIVPEQILTETEYVQPKAEAGFVVSDTERDILKLAVWERHGSNGNTGVGLVRGFGLQRGALASTVAHDSHNLIVVGVDDQDMLTAAVALQEAGGGGAGGFYDMEAGLETDYEQDRQEIEALMLRFLPHYMEDLQRGTYTLPEHTEQSLRHIFTLGAVKEYFYEKMPSMANPLGLGRKAMPLVCKIQNLLIADFLNYLALRHEVYLSTMSGAVKKNFMTKP